MNTARNITSPQLEDNDFVRTSFGRILTEHRLAAGYAQRHFSRLVGISNSHLRKLESGETSPTLTTLYKIARTLDVEAGTLIVELDAEVKRYRTR